MNPLQRVSLPDQAASILRAGIESARWVRELPSEAHLCREMQVSRSTLRKALSQLVREKWLTQGGRGRHHRILRRVKQRRPSVGRVIRALSQFSLAAMGATHHVLLDQVTARLAAAGYRVEFEHEPAIYRRHHRAQLERLLAKPDTAAWLLFFSDEWLQKIFQQRALKCVVVGRTTPGVALPCIYPDTAASARHAAGLLSARGYRELAYLISPVSSRGDQLACEAFTQEAGLLGLPCQVVTYGWSVPELRSALSSFLATRPKRVGFVSASPNFSITTLCHLLNEGIRLPSQAGLICLWDDPLLEHTVPAIARYGIDPSKMARTLTPMLLSAIAHGPRAPRQVQMIPTFVSGGTVAELHS